MEGKLSRKGILPYWRGALSRHRFVLQFFLLENGISFDNVCQDKFFPYLCEH